LASSPSSPESFGYSGRDHYRIERDQNLHAIAKSTGGYAFQPKSLADALRLNELEVLLAIAERPPRPKLPFVSSQLALQQFERYPMDECTDDRVPDRRQMPLMGLPVHELTEVLGDTSETERACVPPDANIISEGAEISPSDVTIAVMKDASTVPSGPNLGKAQQRRALAELRQFLATPHPAIEVFPSDDMSFWKLLLEGPEGTPYQGGLWLLYCNLPSDYPECPPQIRFVTPMRHCNVNVYGRVCHSILDRNYTVDTTILSILHCIYGLLLNPDYDDPLDSTLALEYYAASGVYEDTIRRHVQRFASGRTRAQVRMSLLEGEPEPILGAHRALERDLPSSKLNDSDEDSENSDEDSKDSDEDSNDSDRSGNEE